MNSVTAPTAFIDAATREIRSLLTTSSPVQEGISQRPLYRGEFRIGAYKVTGGRLTEVLIGLKGKRGLRYVGSVRPGIPGLRKHLLQVLRMLRVHSFCPFTGVPERRQHPRALTEHKMAQCQWVEANVKISVDFDGWTESGHLVNPRVVGMQ